VKGDDTEDGTASEGRRNDAVSENEGFSPNTVASRISGSDAEGVARKQGEGNRSNFSKGEWEAIVSAGILPRLTYLTSIDAQGTEHSVRFRGNRVEKHQRSSGWIPVVTENQKFGLGSGNPLEYLRRLELQNKLFGDDIKIIGLTPGNRFVTTQPTLKGGEPTEIEIRDLLETAGWKRIPINLQDLPPALMGSAWWHAEERVILLDARKPNLKRTDFGDILPIDFVLADLTSEMIALLDPDSVC